jgi:hypothetical protein
VPVGPMDYPTPLTGARQYGLNCTFRIGMAGQSWVYTTLLAVSAVAYEELGRRIWGRRVTGVCPVVAIRTAPAFRIAAKIVTNPRNLVLLRVHALDEGGVIPVLGAIDGPGGIITGITPAGDGPWGAAIPAPTPPPAAPPIAAPRTMFVPALAKSQPQSCRRCLRGFLKKA